ncbi:TonB-dependent receptor [Novosphingobium sp.]|uniref:TonB-dependent receptor n=1 Tax=Novosphingobium sp. TaxID=1874826 RepID=UPI0038B8F7BF
MIELRGAMSLAAAAIGMTPAVVAANALPMAPADAFADAPAAPQAAPDAGLSVSGEPLAVDRNGDGVDDNGEILVIARPFLKGQVKAEQPPIVTLDEADIAAYGVGSLQELLAALVPQTGTGRGRGDGTPVILLNGMRISSFREMRGLPPEAIRRVEVLPEEVSLKYGYRPDQRVVNFILKDHFRSFGSETSLNLPARGGYAEAEEEATLTRIEKGARINITGDYQQRSALTEAERGIAYATTPASGSANPADYRTLLASTRSGSLNATVARPLSGGAGLTLNALVQRDSSDSMNGLKSDDPVLSLNTIKRTTTVSGGAALNKPLGSWQMAATLDASHVDATSMIDTADAADPYRARSRTDSVTSLATLSGSPVRLPGGEVSLTGKVGFAWSGIIGTSTRTAATDSHLQRGDGQVGFSLDLPLTSRREGFGAALGDLSFNVNAEVHHLSDFGDLTDYGAGLTWKPVEKLALSASYIGTQAAPGLSDLGGPTVVTPGVTVYDFSTGQSVVVTSISGGNRSLARERQRDIKLAAEWTLPFLANSSLVLEYFRNASNNATSSFPWLTPEVEAAFPGRVVRDAVTGRIVSIDSSPVTIAETHSSRLRTTLNLGGNFGKPDPSVQQRRGAFGALRGAGLGRPPGGFGGAGARPGGGAGAGPGAGPGGGRGPGGFGGGPPPADGRGRWNLSLSHSIELTNTAQIVPGGTVLDLLRGDALTTSGVARHSIQLDAGVFYRGFGLRANGTYTSGTHVDSTDIPAAGRLRFGPLATVNLRLFANLEQIAHLPPGSHGFLKGARLTLAADNLFDGQQKVTDATGQTPLRYQSGYLDPAGRVIKLEFRKQF